MNFSKFKKEIGVCILLAIVSVILIVAGQCIDWFWVQLFGWFVAIYLVVFVIAVLFSESGENASGCGCFMLIIFFIGLVFYNDNMYIAAGDNKQHLYQDCIEISSNSPKQCSEFECFLRGKFSDCEICKNRRKEERKRKRVEREERERQELINYLQSLIIRLENGETADDIEDELEEKYAPEVEYDDEPSIPSRYR